MLPAFTMKNPMPRISLAFLTVSMLEKALKYDFYSLFGFNQVKLQ
jgi:hypothetical protein